MMQTTWTRPLSMRTPSKSKMRASVASTIEVSRGLRSASRRVTAARRPPVRRELASDTALVLALHRTVGNRVVARRFPAPPVQRDATKGTAKPKPRVRATFEEIVQNMNGLGGPYKDLDAWKAAI